MPGKSVERDCVNTPFGLRSKDCASLSFDVIVSMIIGYIYRQTLFELDTQAIRCCTNHKSLYIIFSIISTKN